MRPWGWLGRSALTNNAETHKPAAGAARLQFHVTSTKLLACNATPVKHRRLLSEAWTETSARREAGSATSNAQSMDPCGRRIRSPEAATIKCGNTQTNIQIWHVSFFSPAHNVWFAQAYVPLQGGCPAQSTEPSLRNCPPANLTIASTDVALS